MAVGKAVKSIAILILNFNGQMHLETCLRSVLASRGIRKAQVYLVDNGSTDGSKQYVRQRFPEVELIGFDENLGFARAYNSAVKLLDEDTIVFLNNDVEVRKDWLGKLIEPFSSTSDDRLAICGSKILLYYDRDRVNHAGGSLLPIGGGIDLDFLRPDEGKPASPRFVGCVCGASMAVRRSIFLELGGFDDDFYAYFEDTDLCWRAWLFGYRVLLVPESFVYHKLGATWGSYLNPERIYIGERNRLQCLLKNTEIRNALVGVTVLLFFSALKTIRSLRFGSPGTVFAFSRAYWWTFRNLRKTVVKRRWIQNHRVVRDSYLSRHGLMTSYFEGLREFVRMTSDRRKYSDLFSAGRAGIGK